LCDFPCFQTHYQIRTFNCVVSRSFRRTTAATFTSIAGTFITTTVSLDTTPTKRNADALHQYLARRVASLITTMTAAITTNGAVYTHAVPDAAGTPASVTAPTSGASTCICTAPWTSFTTVAVITVAKPYQTVIVIEAVTVIETITTTIAVAITAGSSALSA